jgi:Meiotically up-regulated gene 113
VSIESLSDEAEREPPELHEGFVYLIKAGRRYKIGRASSVERRHRELAIQLPEPAEVIHRIRTDDPAGIEAYWHKRFADRRLNGEWFALSASDVKVFRRRPRM